MGGPPAGLISNPRSHRNRAGRDPVEGHPGVLAQAPRTRDELTAALADFAARNIGLLLIDGGDGTVRDVLTTAGHLWRERPWPRIAVVPSGKTNALAHDLGLPAGWSREQAIAAAAVGRTARRAPLEIDRHDDPRTPLRGFLMGAGAFVRATELAQRTHKAGAYHNAAVGLTISWAVLKTMIGFGGGEWRLGEAMRVAGAGAAVDGERARYILLASTLERLPLGVKPLGKPQHGLKLLAVDAPPRRMPLAAPAILRGSDAPWLARAGYHRGLIDSIDVAVAGGFILDGELHKGGAFTVRRGPELEFVVP